MESQGNLMTPEMNVTIQSLTQGVAHAQAQLEAAAAEINQLKAQRNQTRSAVADVAPNDTVGPKMNKPNSFSGKGSIESWTIHMNNYLGITLPERGVTISSTCLVGPAHEWRLAQMCIGTFIGTWTGLAQSLRQRLSVLNTEKTARDKMHKWRQVKDVSSLNEDFLSIILNIPNISMDKNLISTRVRL